MNWALRACGLWMMSFQSCSNSGILATFCKSLTRSRPIMKQSMNLGGREASALFTCYRVVGGGMGDAGGVKGGENIPFPSVEAAPDDSVLARRPPAPGVATLFEGGGGRGGSCCQGDGGGRSAAILKRPPLQSKQPGMELPFYLRSAALDICSFRRGGEVALSWGVAQGLAPSLLQRVASARATKTSQ